MKFFSLLVAACIGAGVGFAQAGSPLVFDVTEWDFGEIREADGSVTHTFGFKNDGTTPIAIDRAVTSCGCTTPDYTRGLIRPGERGEVTVTFDPAEYWGEFRKSISVITGGGKNTNFLTIKGEVIPRPESVEAEFPYELGGGVRIDNTMLAFGKIEHGQAEMRTVGVINTSGVEVALDFEYPEASGFLGVYAPKNLCSGCHAEINFGYDLRDKSPVGNYYDVVRPVIDDKPSRTIIYTAMKGVAQEDNAH